MSQRAWWRLAAVAAVLGLIGAGDPTEVIRHKNLGIAFLEQEQPGEAAKEFRELVRLAPGEPLGHADLAIALLRLQRTEEARWHIQKAIELAPDRGDLYGILAEVERWAEQLPASRAALTRAVELAPAEVQLRYALYLDASGQRGGTADPGLAREQLEALHRLAPQNLVVLLKLGRLRLEAGEQAQARALYQAVREIVWDADQRLRGFLDQVITEGDAAAPRAAAFVENLLKASPRYQQGIAELQTNIIGLPVLEFAPGTLPAGVVDRPPELAIRFVAAQAEAELGLRPEVLARADLDNDGSLESVERRGADLVLRDGAESRPLLGAAQPTAVLPIDYDLEGDLDLVVACEAGAPLRLLRNRGDGGFDDIGEGALPELGELKVHGLASADFDEDGDLDLALATSRGILLLSNPRQGRFGAPGAPLGPAPALALALFDANADGWADLAAVGSDSVMLYLNQKGAWVERPGAWKAPGAARSASLLPFEADNDGDLDLLLLRDGAAAFFRNRDGQFEPEALLPDPPAADQVRGQDVDADGDVDLVVRSRAGTGLWRNEGGHRYHWLDVRLDGINSGNTKNNKDGIGCRIEVKTGSHYQMRLVTEPVTHFGLGQYAQADLVRVLWTNGVPQNRFKPAIDALLTEKQVLKGSCPFLYAWNGERFEFITDLFWTSPLGLPLAPGVFAPADPDEEILIRAEQLRLDGQRYRLVVTEELWETAYVDALDLWVIDHPAEAAVFSNHKFQPAPYPAREVRALTGLRPPRAAVDGEGRDVLELVRAEDERYAAGYRPSRWQGLAQRPYSLTFELGDLSGAETLRLLLTGWIFPTDASLNLAIAQSGRRPLPPVLEVPDGRGGWRRLLDPMPFPPGKTKSIVLDLDPRELKGGRFRITTDLWLHWDRVAFTTETGEVALRRTVLKAASAELSYRGFSQLYRLSGVAPHRFDFSRVSLESPWLPIAGRFTRFGEVTPLLEAVDGRSVVLGPGDAIEIAFDAAALPPLPSGWRRDFLLRGFGWDKDSDRNTATGEQVAPLPFPGMPSYPYDPRAIDPSRRAELEAYDRLWNTREVAPWQPGDRLAGSDRAATAGAAGGGR
ncbi:MAG TPA: FG-GAP-like repeat-containing protein [Acidobacteriota bacterium]